MEAKNGCDAAYYELLIRAGPVTFGKLRSTGRVPVVELPRRSILMNMPPSPTTQDTETKGLSTFIDTDVFREGTVNFVFA